MVVEFPVSIYGPDGWQGDLPEVELELTDTEYEAVRRWVYEMGEVGDYPELEHIKKKVISECLDNLDAASIEPDSRQYDPGSMEFVLQYPDVDASDLDYNI